MQKLYVFVAILLLMFYNSSVFANELEISSNDFLDNGILPVLYSCDGNNTTPHITWSNVDSRAKSLALIMTSKNAKGEESYHWLLYDLPAKLNELPENLMTPPSGSKIGINSWDKASYMSPCPERGSIGHYYFALYVLDKKLNLPSKSSAATVMDAMKGYIIQSKTLTAIYSRWPVELN